MSDATPDEWYLDRVSGNLFFLPGPDDGFLPDPRG